MRRRLALLVTMLLVLVSAASASHRERQAELLDEVLRLSHEGVPDQIIIKHIYTMDFVFEFTADDIIELRSLGVSDEVLEALIDTALVEDDEEVGYERHATYLRISTGYYSPWYYFPYAWGYYYDPFPSYYSYYYYPFHYRFHTSFGYYGWCGTTYYYAYHPRHGHHGKDHRGSPYHVADRRDTRRVMAPSRNPGAAVPEPRVRESLPPRRVVSEHRTGDQLRTRGAAQGATEVKQPVRPGTTPEARPAPRRLEEGKAPTSVRQGRGAAKRVDAPVAPRRNPREVKSPRQPKRQTPATRLYRPQVRTSRQVRETAAPRVRPSQRTVAPQPKREAQPRHIITPSSKSPQRVQRPVAPIRSRSIVPAGSVGRGSAAKISSRRPRSR